MAHRKSIITIAERQSAPFHESGNTESGKVPERRNSTIPGVTDEPRGAIVHASEDAPEGLNREAPGNMSISLEVQQLTDVESIKIQWSDWAAARCRSCLGVSEEQFNSAMSDAASVAVFTSFFVDIKQRLMFAVLENSGEFSFVGHPPFASSSAAPTFAALFFVKLSQPSYSQFTEVSPDDVLVGTMSSNILDHLSILSSEVIFPVLTSALSSDAVSETLARDLTASFHQFLSQSYITLGLSRGRTLLPLPPKDSITAALVNDKAASKDKERIHLLENCVITWTRQIRSVLKLEGLTESGESVLQISQGISTEFDLWRSRADNLSSLYEQLQSERLRKVLRILEATKSTYYVPFTRLCKEVAVAREEAMELNRYYRPIRKLADNFMKTASIWNFHFLFRPICHMFLLAWRESSRHFAQSSRLSVCFEKLGNNIIQLATCEITGKGILSDTTPRAESLLRQAVMVSAMLRTVFIDYRQKSELDRSGSNPWKIQESSVFAKLDLFLERCHDILDLVETNQQFSLLKNSVIGGARGKKLTRMVAQIHQEFVVAFERVRGLPYNIFDISLREFDDDYFEFRTCVRSLERRMSVLVIEGMDADSSLQGSFKILQSLSSMLGRKLIQQTLNSRFLKLLEQGRAEIKKARELFVAHKTSPLLSIGMPLYAGSILWARSLLQRAQISLSGFQQLLPFMLVFEEGKELCEIFAQLELSVQQFEVANVEKLSKSVGSDILDLLKHPLLLRDKATSMLSVNMDAQLFVFAREARCFRSLGLKVPEPVQAVESKAEMLRQHVSNLDLIVRQYNNIKQLLNPVEAQLLSTKLQHVDASLEEAMRSMTWKSHSIPAFLKRIMVLIKECSHIVHVIKTSCQSIEDNINSWSLVSLFDVQFRRTVTVPVFLEDFKGAFAGRAYELKEQANSIHSKINQVHMLLGISRGEVSWRNFISNLSQRILECLKSVTARSLQALQDLVDPVHNVNKNLPPLLEIRVELVAPDVLFSPDLRTNIKGESVTSVLKIMVDAVTAVPSMLKKLDIAGDFGEDVLSEHSLQEQIKNFWHLIDGVFFQCNGLFAHYVEFHHLWELESSVVFNEFLENIRSSVLPFDQELQRFDSALSKIRISENRVRELPNFAQFSWLRVDCKPMKQALYTWISKWSFCYTEYLSNKLHTELQELMTFVRTTSSSLARVVDGDHSASLDQIVSHMSNVFENKDSSVAILKRMSMIQSLLNTCGFDCPSWIPRALTALPDEIVTLNDLATRCRFQLDDVIELQRSRILDRVEKFRSALEVFALSFKASLPLALDISPDVAYKMISSLAASEPSSGSLSLSTMLSQSNSIRNLQLLYDLPQSSFPEIDLCWEDCLSLKHVWDFVSLVEQTLLANGSVHWMSVDLEAIKAEFQFHSQVAQDLPESARIWDITKAIIKRVHDVIETISLLILVRSSQIKERFWKMILRVVMQNNEQEKSTATLLGMISLRLCDHSDLIHDILFKASRESEVEAILKNLQDTWEEQVFSINISNEASAEETGGSVAQDEHVSEFVFEDLPMLARPHSLIDLLTDSMLRLQNLSRDSFVSGNQTFAEDVQRWQRRLSMVEAAIDLWFLVQNRIRTLSSLFASSPKLAALFPENFSEVKVLRQRWWRIMRVASEKPTAIDVCNEEGHLATLRAMATSLEMEEAALQKHVTSMCETAPRLLLLPSNQAIVLLGAGSDGGLINSTISGIFPGVSCIIWAGSSNLLSVAPPDMRSPSKQSIKSNARVHHSPTIAVGTTSSDADVTLKGSIFAVAVRGRLGEVIKFESQQHVNCSGSATDWLPILVNSVREVLVSQVVAGVKKSACSSPGTMWFEEICGQVASLCCSIEHTSSVIDALKRHSAASSAENLEALLSTIDFEISARAIALQQDTWTPASGIPGIFPSALQAGLSDDERRKIAQTIICSLSYRDLISSLIGDGVTSCEDFAVLAMPRVSYNEADVVSNPVVVRLGFSEFKYQFEYSGEEYRPTLLCPTTVRSMAAVFAASEANSIPLLVGSVCGRGSLANEIALLRGSTCLSFSLNWVGSELSLTRIIAAATATGITLCLDVDRTVGSKSTALLPSILSVLSSTCIRVFAAIRAGSNKIIFDEFSIPLENLSVSIVLKSCITSFYGSLLPPAFLSLLRPVHVRLPSLVVCAEALLFCEGFYYARNLASRLDTLFTLCSTSVSSVHRVVPFQWNLYVLRSVVTASAFLMYSRDALEIQQSVTRRSSSPQIEQLDAESELDSPTSPSPEKSEISRSELRELRLVQQGILDALLPRLDPEEVLRLAVAMETVFSPLTFPKCTASKSRPPTSQLARSRPISAQASISFSSHHFKLLGKRESPSRGELRTPLSAGRRKTHSDKTPLLRDSEWSTFENAFIEAALFCDLHVTEELLSCASRLHASLAIRTSAAIIGPVGCGKTGLWKTMSCMRSQDLPVVSAFPFYQHALPASVLYGSNKEFNGNTIWSPGMLEYMFNQLVSSNSDARKERWLIFDGPMDSTFGDVILPILQYGCTYKNPNLGSLPLYGGLRIIFETSSVAFASPALVSSIGIVNFSHEAIDCLVYIHGWLQRVSSTGVDVGGNMRILIPSSLVFLAENALCDSTGILSSALVAAAEIRGISRSLPEQLVAWKCKCASQVCDFLDAFLSNQKEVFPSSDFGQSNHSLSASNALSESINFAILWAIGGDMTELQRQKFSTWAVDAFQFDNHSLPQNLYDCFFNGDSWLDWNEHVPQTIFMHQHARQDTGTDTTGNLLVPTSETTCILHLLEMHSLCRHPVLLTGSAAVGKSAILREKISQTDNETTISSTMFLHAHSSCSHLQDAIECCFERKFGRVFGPLSNKKLLLVIEDVHLPIPDAYGHRNSYELLRQVLDSGFMYDRQHFAQRILQGYCIIAASRPQDDTGSRFMRHFVQLQTYGPSHDVLISIFTNVLSSALSKMSDGVRRLIPAIVRSTIDVVWDMQENVSLDVSSMSVFNMHMVARVIEAMFSLDPNVHDSQNSVLHMWLSELYSTVGDFLTLKDDALLLKESVSSRLKSNFNSSDILDASGQSIIFVQVIPLRSSTSSRHSSMFVAASEIASQKPSNPVSSRAKVGFLRAANLATKAIRGKEESDSDAMSSFSLQDCEKIPTQPLDSKPLPFSEISLQELLKYSYQLISAYPLLKSFKVICSDVAIHAARISFNLNKTFGGHAVIVGNRGCGKRTAALLAAVMGRFAFLEAPLLSSPHQSHYLISDFAKHCIAGCGVYSKRILAYFSFDNLSHSDLLLVSTLIGGFGFSQAMALFSRTERNTIFQAMRPQMRKSGLVDTPESCWMLFCRRVSSNFRICFSIISSKFEQVIVNVPCMHSNALVLRFNSWTPAALSDLCQRRLGSMCKDSVIVEALAAHIVTLHSHSLLANPKFPDSRILRMLDCFEQLFQHCSEYIQMQSSQLSTALNTLSRIPVQMAEYEVITSHMQSSLNQRAANSTSCLSQVGSETTIMEDFKAALAKDEDYLAQCNENRSTLQAEWDAICIAAQPFQLALEAALLSLDKDALAELRSMPTPPESVCLVVAAVSSVVNKLSKVSTMRMSWIDAKKVLLHPDKLLLTLQKTGVNSVNAACIAAVEDAFISNDKFVPEKIEEASLTAAKLCQWVISFVNYYQTILSGLPVQAALQKATQTVETANQRKVDSQLRLHVSIERIASLTRAFEVATEEKTAAAVAVQNAEDHVNIARRLLAAFETLHPRWRAKSDTLELRKVCLVGDCCVASLVFAYSGLLTKTEVYDAALLSYEDLSTRGVPLSIAKSNSIGLVGSDAQVETLSQPQILMRNLSSLLCCGSDEASFLRALSHGTDIDILKFTTVFSLRHFKNCWPLIVDPMHVVAGVISAMSSSGSVVHVHNSDVTAVTVMVAALRQGKTVIYVLDEAPVPSLLLPVFFGRFEHSEISPDQQGMSSKGKAPSSFSYSSVSIEGKGVIDVHPSFSMILVCDSEQSLSFHPRLIPHVIPTAFRRDGSSHCQAFFTHVLAKVIPSLESMQSDITEGISKLTVELSTNEVSLLQHLCDSTDILGRPDVVQMIESARLFDASALVNVQELQARHAVLQEQIWFQQPLLELFCTLSDISGKLNKSDCSSDTSIGFLLSIMQSLSVVFLMPHADLILSCTDVSGENRDVCQVAVNNAIRSIAEQCLRVLLSSVEVPDKLIALLWFCQKSDACPENEKPVLDALIRSLATLNLPAEAAISCPVPWLSSSQWARFYQLSSFPSIRLAHAVSDIRFLRDWVACRMPEVEPMPGLLRECTPVERLVLLLYLRPDRIIQASTAFLEAVSYPDFCSLLTESPHTALEQIIRNPGLANFPIVFVGELSSWALDSMMARCGIASIEHILLDAHSNARIIEAAADGGCVAVNVSSESSAAILQSCLAPVLLLMIRTARSSKCPTLVSRPEEMSLSSSSTTKHVFQCIKDWSNFFAKNQLHPGFRIIIIVPSLTTVPHSLRSECVTFVAPPPELFAPLSHSLDCSMNFAGSLSSQLQANFLHILSDSPNIATQGQNSTWPVSVVSAAVLHAVLSLTLPSIGKDLLFQMVTVSRNLPLQSSFTAPPRNSSQLVDALLSLAITHVSLSASMRTRLRLLCDCICTLTYATYMPVSPHFVSFPQAMTNSDGIKSYVHDTFTDLVIKNGISFPGHANSCAMQPITEIPSFFVRRFAQLCSSGINAFGFDIMRPSNLKDSARLLVEEVLSGFPELVPTDNLERQIKECGTAQLVGYHLQGAVASVDLLLARDGLNPQPTTHEIEDPATTQPVLLFVLNEVQRANSLMSLMQRNLVELDLLLQGRVTGDSGGRIGALLRALANSEVPHDWEAACKTPILLWISNFFARVRALHLWAPQVGLMSVPVLWLPHFHKPQAIFSALKLAAAAKEGISLDHIQIEWELTKKPYAAGQSAAFRMTNAAGSTAYCVSFGGISLIGAQWSAFTQVLEDCDPALVNELSVVCARACLKTSSSDVLLHRPSDEGFSVGEYDCPVYSDRGCTHLLFSMKLKSLVHTAKWAMIGVHAVLSSETSDAT